MIRFYLKRRSDGSYVQSITPTVPTHPSRSVGRWWPTKAQAQRDRRKLCAVAAMKLKAFAIVRVRVADLPPTPLGPVDRRCSVEEDGSDVFFKFRAVPGCLAVVPEEAHALAHELLALPLVQRFET